MMTVERRALEWLLGGDTGISSKTVCGHMLGIAVDWGGPPSDAGDRGRCIRLLNLIPEWWDRLDELAENEKPRNSIVIDADGFRPDTNSWAAQIPLIRKESAPKESV